MKPRRLVLFCCLYLLIALLLTYAQSSDNPILRLIDKSKNMLCRIDENHGSSYNSIPEKPALRTVVVGDTAKFCLNIAGQDITYQWYKDGETLKGENKASLIIPEVDYCNEGKYWCRYNVKCPCINGTGDTTLLMVMPYKGFDPDSISGLSLWFKEDKGLWAYTNGTASQIPVPCNGNSVCASSSCPASTNCKTSCGVAGLQKMACTTNPSCAGPNTCTTNNIICDNGQTCFSDKDINVATTDFTFSAIFSDYCGKNCDTSKCNNKCLTSFNIFSCGLFSIACCGGICSIRYENGIKDTLKLTNDIGHIVVTKSGKGLIVYLNDQVIRIIIGADFNHLFSSIACKQNEDGFCIGSQPVCCGLWEGFLKEFVLYRKALTFSEIEQVRTYLVSKYTEHLNNIWHSQWAYAPAFHPSIKKYKAVLPSYIDTLTVDVVKSSPDLGVKIAGQNPPFKISHINYFDSVTIQVETPMGPLNYQLSFERTDNYVIFVNKSALGAETGTSWYYAYKDLQKALDDAGKNGKEIWVAEGTYLPSRRTELKDPRSATFLMFPGTEIIGGFRGDEIEKKPVGSSYATLISGDLEQNDSNVNATPPIPLNALLNDNSYHVITIRSYMGGLGVRFEGFSISGGVANGNNKQYIYGGGIYCPGVTQGISGGNQAGFTLERCIITGNWATSQGGGMCCRSAPYLINQCLFENNQSIMGSGGGLFAEQGDTLTVESTIFSGNYALDTINGMGGGCELSKIAQANFTNSVAINDYAGANGGFMYVYKTTDSLINCTVTNNSSQKGNGGFVQAGGVTNVINSIFWNNAGEFYGDSINVTYSCITNGHNGIGNMSDDPQFEDTGNPKGKDSVFGTIDDGLRLKSTSPVIGKSSADFPEYDILEMKRVGNRTDLGAYVYIATQEASDFLGIKYNNGNNFLKDANIYVYKPFQDIWHMKLAIKSRNARYLRVFIPDNRATNRKQSLVLYMSVLDKNGIAISGVSRRTISLTREGNINGQFVFYSAKPIVFINDIAYVNNDAVCDCNEAYFIYGSKDVGHYTLLLPVSQF